MSSVSGCPERSATRTSGDPYLGDAPVPRGAELFILICIVASCALVVVELCCEDWIERQGLAGVFWLAELTFTAIFTVEYAVRWYNAPNRRLYPFTPLALIDLLAVLPSWLALTHVLSSGEVFLGLRAVRGSRMLRLMRLLRLLRLLKLTRHGYVVYRVLAEWRIKVHAFCYHYRLRPLGRLVLIVLAFWFVGANVLHLTEQQLGDGQSGYRDYFASYWNVIIVLMSGMDADAPTSFAGRIWLLMLLAVGMIVVGMLTGEIVSVLVRRAMRSGMIPLKPPRLRLEHHLVILGRNAHLEQIIRQVRAALRHAYYIVVVAENADSIPAADIPAYHRVFAIAADPSQDEVLEEAAIEDALRVIVLSGDDKALPVKEHDDRAMMQALAVSGRNPNVPMVVQLREPASLRYVSALDGAECVAPDRYAERMLALAVLSPGISALYDELMSFENYNSEIYATRVPSVLVGKDFAAAQLYFLDHDEEALVLIGMDRGEDGGICRRYHLQSGSLPDLPDDERILREDDRLLVMAYQRPSFDWATHEDLISGRALARV